MSNISYLSLGSNKGDRLNNLKKAINLLSSLTKIKVKKISTVYETEPWGYQEQNKFLNLCLEIKTALKPKELLRECQNIETILKRERIVKWGPRTIDIDILFYGDLIIMEKDLIIPHPLINQRAFVLIPLADLNQELIIKDKNILEWLQLIEKNDVRPYKEQIEFEII